MRGPGVAAVLVEADPPSMQLRPDTLALTALLALLTALGPLSTDMYLPSMPDIARAFATSEAQVQLTLASNLVGFAVGQIVYGPVSDRHGRRPVLMAALALYAGASVACVFAPTIDGLIVLRFLQALGGSGAIVLGRAVVRDLYSGARAGRELSRMGMIMGLAPIAAPVVGGLLQAWFGWQANFYALGGFGVIAIAVVWLLLPETVPHRASEPLSLRTVGADYLMLLRHPSVAAHIGLLSLTYAGLFAWISSASFVLQDVYGLNATDFGVAFAVSSVGFMLGSTTASRSVGRIGLGATIGVGAVAAALAGLAMLFCLATGLDSTMTLVGAVVIYTFAVGMVLPQSIAGALTPFPQRAGTASSLAGFIQQTAAALLGAGTMASLGATAWPLAGMITLLGGATLVLWITTRRTRAA